MRAEVD